MKVPRIVIAGTNSGCGKTTVSIGIMSALKNMGTVVQPYKTGPDYIDTMLHTEITGRRGSNLDSWLLDENVLKHVLCNNFKNAGIAVIEGVMGLFDGFGTTSMGSTAHVSKILNAPIILVINGGGMSLSVAALVKGFSEFDSDVNIKGIILNNIKSKLQFDQLKVIIEKNTGIDVIGFLYNNIDFSIESRHLGLKNAHEIENLIEKISVLSSSINNTVDLKKLIEIAEEACEIEYNNIIYENIKNKYKGLKIGVAYDKAFNFYYNDNIDLLKIMGAEIEFFSPLEDSRIPEGINGLYIGGGYPEICCKKLEENYSMREDIIKSAERGMTIYAECGGLMYLSESIKLTNGCEFEMCGIIKVICEMGNKLKRFGYVECTFTKDCILGKKGFKIKGHEFHYSFENFENNDTCFLVAKIRDGNKDIIWKSGYTYKNVLASYPHIHFLSNLKIADNFLNSCMEDKLC